MNYRKIIICLITGIILLYVLKLGLLEGVSQYFYNLRNCYFLSFNYRYDDFIPYLPIIIMFGLKIAGVKSRSNWKRMLMNTLYSFALMWLIVYLVKSFSGVIRPDGSDCLSFPSGHTATAFTSACLLYKEYASKTLWITVFAFLPAIVTGLTRILNNKHWFSDVIGGAVVAVCVVEIIYLINKCLDYKYQNK